MDHCTVRIGDSYAVMNLYFGEPGSLIYGGGIMSKEMWATTDLLHSSLVISID